MYVRKAYSRKRSDKGWQKKKNTQIEKKNFENLFDKLKLLSINTYV